MSPEIKHQATLRSAAELLARHPGAGTDEIARSAGISRATLHRQFANRDVLIDALEDLGIREIEAALDAARLDDDRAADALRRLADAVAPSAGLLAFLMSQAQLWDRSDPNPGWDRIDHRVQDLFRRGQRDGDFRIDQNPVWLAEAVYGLISSAAWCIHTGLVGQAEFPTMIVDLLLDGVRRQEGS
ncbi:TetR/AcrR family transcriptional regulator [Microlunatus soli]|uniref:TetR/AcrR family transcriptional regulator n=1 Tax=Microlunatus soli TaxID=630515 RepID=UPI0018D2C2D0|nr:TetR/AcrR family transcriptional regulator [Microlunatus soli]